MSVHTDYHQRVAQHGAHDYRAEYETFQYQDHQISPIGMRVLDVGHVCAISERGVLQDR